LECGKLLAPLVAELCHTHAEALELCALLPERHHLVETLLRGVGGYLVG
jgi:hypothetical protein